MALIVSEELDRLSYVYEYSSKVSNMQEFKLEIINCKRKLSELLAQQDIKVESLNSEYENQKK
jgi:hypothetical protein